MATYPYTRDLRERQEELKDDLADLQEAVHEAQEALNECDEEEEQEALADPRHRAEFLLDWLL